MKRWLLVAVLTLTSLQTPQVNLGAIKGRVTRPGLSEGVSEVQITSKIHFHVHRDISCKITKLGGQLSDLFDAFTL
jgi:hypothetical protein